MSGNVSSVETLFAQAIEVESEVERAAFLDQACGNERELRGEVEQLVRDYFRAGEFLEKPALDGSVVIAKPTCEGPGTMVGPYKLLEQIGEGGFGVVFMAEQQQPLRRKVALKVLKPGMDTKQVIARFEAERQALAIMDHPNIAKVLDAGQSNNGRPYFVMDLVKGLPITDYCDESHLTLRKRLELFVHVCRAVQHAHQKGIIHRDLKPSNVLVTLHDGTPLVKVIDFGIAKALDQRLTDKTLFTGFAQMIGSPLYMSPEQAALSNVDVDTRSDIYSLGVLLYELLTGTTPFDGERLRGAGYEEMRRIIREEEPPKPSTRLTTLGQAATTASARRRSDPRRLGQLFRGELDWIVMKCLEKDRNRRYETANGLARDVERYLHDEPVHACPPTALYRFQKFARREKVALAIASAAAIVVLLGVVGLAVSYAWIKRERDAKVLALDAAQANYAKAEEQRQAADESSRKARQAVDQFFTQISESTLLDVPGLQPLRKELLEAALKYHQAFLERRSMDPELQAEAAASYFRVAQIYNIMDQNDDAVRAVQQGLDIAEKLVRDYPDRPGLALRMAGFYKSGRLFHRGSPLPSNPMAALRSLEKGAALWERFVRDNPTAAELRSDLAGIHGYLAAIQLARRQYAAALASFQKVAGMWAELVSEYPAAPDYRAELAGSRDRVGELLHWAKRPEEAENAFREAQELWEELAASFPKRAGYRMEVAECYNALARRLRAVRKYQEADDAVARALAILTKLVADAPNVPAYRDTLGFSYTDLGSSLRRQGRPQESAAAYRQAVAIYDKLAPEFPTAPRYREQQAHCGELLSLVLLDAGEPAEAALAHGRAVAAQELLVAAFPAVPSYREELCMIVIVWPRPADREVKLAVELASRALAVEPNNANYWKDQGGAQYRAGNWDAAQPALEKALEMGASKSCWFFLAMIQAGRGNHEQADNFYRQAAQSQKKKNVQNERFLRLRAETEEVLRSKRAAPQSGADKEELRMRSLGLVRG